MSVVNGQIANQTTFNNAFMSRTSATTQTIAQVQLENTEVESGPFVANVQRAVNKAFEGVGATGEADTTVNDYSSNNYVANGDNRKVAVGKLDTQLKQTQDDLDAAEVEIAVHETRLDDHDTTLADHESRIDSAELTIIDHEGRIDTLETTSADHESRITDLESNDMNIGGNKTFTGDVVVVGNFEVQGTTTSINSTNTEVEDQNILVNKNGTDGSSEGAGLDVERPAGNAGIHFDSTLASKFKLGLLTNLYEVIVSGVAQTIAGLKDFTSGVKTDTINESTLDFGVTVEGVLIKDGLVDNRDVSADGTILDGHTATLSNHDGRITDIESGNNTFAGTKTFSGDVTFQQTAAAQSVVVNENLFLGSVANTQTGSDQEIDATAPLVRLTGVGLISIDRIVAPPDAKVIALVNQTGASISLKDNSGSPAANRIRTGTDADMQLANNQIAFIVYEPTLELWYVSSLGNGGGVAYQETPAGIVNGLNPNFGPLTYLPSSNNSVAVFVDGVTKVLGVDFSVSSATITFNPGSIPAPGQTVYSYYLTQGNPSLPLMSGELRAEYRTVTLAEEAAKALVLIALPSSPSEVILDVITGGPQFYGDDFTVSGSTLSWSGLGLDGLILAGDKVRITYVT